MAFDDVEKRLNSSLDALIASSKKVGAGRGGRVRVFLLRVSFDVCELTASAGSAPINAVLCIIFH